MSETRTGGFGTCWGRMTRRRGVIVLAGALALTIPLASADAGTQTLCRGYSQCASAGYSDAGYHKKSDQSFWRMYTGPNCTNYVAYRLILDGLADDRPAADPGQSNASLNAFAWGVVYASLTNAVPKVGSVAWWGANAGKGSIGHVAYVEKVHRDGAITISEDSSSGNGFAWKKLTPGQGWPQGFIHFGAGNPRPQPLPDNPARGRDSSPDRIPSKKPRGDFGGEWGGIPDWATQRWGPARPVPGQVSPAPVQRDRTEVIAPKRTKPKKKVPGKRAARRVAGKEMGGEVGGALGGMSGWNGSWGSAPR